MTCEPSAERSGLMTASRAPKALASAMRPASCATAGALKDTVAPTAAPTAAAFKIPLRNTFPLLRQFHTAVCLKENKRRGLALARETVSGAGMIAPPSPPLPEWAPHEAVWIGFPSDPELWLGDLKPAEREVAAFAEAVHAGGKGENVWLVAAHEDAAASARRLCPFAKVIVEPFGDIWLRDTGPIILGTGERSLRTGLRLQWLGRQI